MISPCSYCWHTGSITGIFLHAVCIQFPFSDCANGDLSLCVPFCLKSIAIGFGSRQTWKGGAVAKNEWMDGLFFHLKSRKYQALCFAWNLKKTIVADVIFFFHKQMVADVNLFLR